MTASTLSLVDLLERSGLVPPAPLADALAVAATKADGTASVDEQLESLVEKKLLTPFQAARVRSGNTAELVLGNYVLLDEIGQGGMGHVYRARHTRMDRIVALKVLSPDVVQSPTAIARFHREVKAAARLSHPNIVTAYDADDAGGIHFLVMEYVPGADLARVVQDCGTFPVDEAVDCLIQIATGLVHAHERGIVHRDIKPANILLDPSGTVKILDMGLARLEDPRAGEQRVPADERIAQSGSMRGTIDFMAPEQADSEAHIDRRADIYSLGCTLFYLLTGQIPYSGNSISEKLVAHRSAPIPSLRQLAPAVSVQLEDCFARMLAKSPADRPQTMREVLAVLKGEATLAPLPVPADAPIESAASVAERVVLPAEASVEVVPPQVEVALPMAEGTIRLAAHQTEQETTKIPAPHLPEESPATATIAAAAEVSPALPVQPVLEEPAASPRSRGWVWPALVLGVAASGIGWFVVQSWGSGSEELLLKIDQKTVRVTLDGQPVTFVDEGQSPSSGNLHRLRVPLGEHELRIEKPGFQAYVKSVSAKSPAPSGPPVPLEIKLLPVPDAVKTAE